MAVAAVVAAGAGAVEVGETVQHSAKTVVVLAGAIPTSTHPNNHGRVPSLGPDPNPDPDPDLDPDRDARACPSPDPDQVVTRIDATVIQL